MKQFQFTFRDDKTLEEELHKLRQWVKSNLYSKVLIQICTEILDRERIGHVCKTIERMLPEALYAGCSSNGNIVNGDFSGGSITVVCTLFEYPATKVELLQYPLQADTQESIVKMLAAEVDKRPWVKAVELLVTIRGMSMTTLCEHLSHIRTGVQIFGGGAFCEDLEKDDACVFSKASGYQEKGIVFILFGGEDFHVESSFVTGWKPLGSFLNVTATDGCILKELNNRPAYDIYYKYLHIQNDEHFFNNTLEFPFLYRYNGIDIMRAPVASNPDGSLTMTSDMSQNVKARIAYGDPWTILDAAWKEGNRLLKFAPECIFVFSCAARRTFWGNSEVGKETEPYQRIAPTSGFYTSGEFLRTGDTVNQHNVTQVIAAMREGEAKEHPEKELSMAERTFEGKVSMINRMATFIKATTQELEEANQKLRNLAVVDAMTGVGNKTAYLEKIHSLDDEISRGTAYFSVFVFDLNSLKELNDKFGHECGDMAITDVAKALKAVFGKDNLYRIGGDEFIAVFDGTKQPDPEPCFRKLEEALQSQDYADRPYKAPLAIAKGVAAFRPGEDTEYRDVFRRADNAMYQEKAAYYRAHDRRRH
ncbi:MAG: diguanylate cyclase [Acidaminococcaceae bacterium]|nr:diguanylate cyclase [Acidaminococcaceae bacterium]